MVPSLGLTFGLVCGCKSVIMLFVELKNQQEKCIFSYDLLVLVSNISYTLESITIEDTFNFENSRILTEIQNWLSKMPLLSYLDIPCGQMIL